MRTLLLLLTVLLAVNLAKAGDDGDNYDKSCWQLNMGRFPNSTILAQYKFQSDETCMELCKERPDCNAAVTSPNYSINRECYLVDTFTVTERAGWSTALKPCLGNQSDQSDCMKNNFDYYGADIRSVPNVASWYHCIEMCRDVEGCRSIAFAPSNGQCWFKSRDRGASPRQANDRQSVTLSCMEIDPWIPVERNAQYFFDPDVSALQIKTDSQLGSEDKVVVWFRNEKGSSTGGLSLHFSSLLKYSMLRCQNSHHTFLAHVPSDYNKVWTIETIGQTTGIKITCNGELLLSFVFSDATCTGHSTTWREYWNRSTKGVYFPEDDTASEYWRAVAGTGFRCYVGQDIYEARVEECRDVDDGTGRMTEPTSCFMPRYDESNKRYYNFPFGCGTCPMSQWEIICTSCNTEQCNAPDRSVMPRPSGAPTRVTVSAAIFGVATMIGVILC